MPAGRVEVVMLGGGKDAGLTVMDRFLVSLSSSLSSTRTVKFDVPAVVGVPLISPDADTDRPVGSEPDVMDQL